MVFAFDCIRRGLEPHFLNACHGQGRPNTDKALLKARSVDKWLP